MTLIAAFRCEIDGEEGVVFCADSQESYGNYRVTVDKIKPRDANNYDLIIGGAGNIAPAIDGLSNTLERWIQGWPEGYTEEKARGLIEHKIVRYTKGQILNYPTSDDKVLDFLICLRDKSSKAIYLWRATGTIVERVVDHDLIGWDEPLYKYEARRLYPKLGATEVTAITLGLHLLSVGKATATSIDLPFLVIGIGKKRLWVEEQTKVDAWQQRISQVNQTLGRLITAIPDMDISDDTFQNALNNFRSETLGLREQVQGYSGYSGTSGRFKLVTEKGDKSS